MEKNAHTGNLIFEKIPFVYFIYERATLSAAIHELKWTRRRETGVKSWIKAVVSIHDEKQTVSLIKAFPKRAEYFTRVHAGK